jgi:tetratricopeptide (TPR) repeat protein
MSLDADDYLEKDVRQKLIALKKELKKLKPDAVTVGYRYDFDKDNVVPETRTRIVRKTSNPRWVGSIHEILEFSGDNVIDVNFAITTAKPPERQMPDLHRNLGIFEKMIANGQELNQREKALYAFDLYGDKQYERAIEYFEDYIDSGAQGIDTDITVFNLLTKSYKEINDNKSALKTQLRSLEFILPGAETCCDIALNFFNKKLVKESAFWFKLALLSNDWEADKIKNEFYSVYIPNLYLGGIYFKRGDFKQGYFHNEAAGKYNPNDQAYLAGKQMYKNLGFG